MILDPDRVVEVGQLRKSHGIDGALRATIEEAFRDYVWDAECLFLEIDGDLVPFRIEYIKGEEEAPIFKFIWVDDPEAAALYSGIRVFLEKKYLPEGFDASVKNELHFGFLVGFTLFDDELGLIGPILEVEEYPQQEMAVVNYRENEYLIPVHPNLILSLDLDNRLVVMDLPEGLFDSSV